MATDPLVGRFVVTQTWEQHLRNAGANLGGVDYGPRVGVREREMPRGTRLPVVSGVVEFVTPTTRPVPSWYNSGLGYAGAYRRPDGTRTVYGHLSGRDGNVFLSGGQKGSEGAGKSTGGHVHIHDVLADGRTRARPFSTVPAGGGFAGGGLTPIEEEDMQAIPVIFDQHRQGMDDSAHPDFASTGIIWPWGFEQTSKGRASRADYEGGISVARTLGLTVPDAKHADINALALIKQHGDVTIVTTGGGASKADVDAAAARVIDAVPRLSGDAARAAIVK